MDAVDQAKKADALWYERELDDWGFTGEYLRITDPDAIRRKALHNFRSILPYHGHLNCIRTTEFMEALERRIPKGEEKENGHRREVQSEDGRDRGKHERILQGK